MAGEGTLKALSWAGLEILIVMPETAPANPDLTDETEIIACSSAAAPETDLPPSTAVLWRNPLVEWTITEGRLIADAPRLVAALGEALNRMGLPVFRLRVTIRTLHPQFIGVSYTWRRDSPDVDEYFPPYAILMDERYLNSPYAALFEGAGGFRQRIDPGSREPLRFRVLEELRRDGATDYVAMPLVFSDGKIAAITIATDRPGGFGSVELTALDETLPILAPLFEVHALRRTAHTILDTYLGPQSGGKVLKGLIRRGDGEDILAVIWYCDLRGSTALADRLPRSAFFATINDFFECMAQPVMARGGDILHYIGDAMLAIFPIGETSLKPEDCPSYRAACERALAAALDARERVGRWNARRRAQGERELGFGIALHLGEVLYGNIGVPERLEFTVIGSATNEAARIETMCKMLERPILLSDSVAAIIPERVVSLGWHGLKGVRAAHELFAVREPVVAANPRAEGAQL